MQNENLKFEKACAQLGISTALPDVSMLPEDKGRYILNHYKLITLIEAKNKGKRADFTDGNWKYYPWPGVCKDETHPSGFGFSHSLCDRTHSYTSVGSRLCLHSSDDALEALEEFKEEYIINQLL